MARKSGSISLTSYDEIFSTEQSRTEEKLERVQIIPLDQLRPFKDHPFKVLDDDLMQRTLESISKFGVLVPGIARPMPEGGYELVAGHRRHHASEMLGIKGMPVIVRDMTDDEAIILMVDSNLQREKLLPGERAKAYKMKLDAIKRQGQRTDLTSAQIGPKLTAAEKVAEEANDSKSQVKRFIRLTFLIPELLDMVDRDEIKFNPAVELSYLSKSEQYDFIDAMEYAQTTPSLSQAQRLKELSQKGGCSKEAMYEVMSEEKKDAWDRVTLKPEVLKKYFPKNYTPKQMQDTIIKLLEGWCNKRNRNQNHQI